MEGKIVDIPKRLSWDFVESRMTPIGGTDWAIIDVFSKCFQLSIFTLANTLLADPVNPPPSILALFSRIVAIHTTML
jgi:hypothetical protein